MKTAAPSIDAIFEGRVASHSTDVELAAVVRDYLAASRAHLEEMHASGAAGHSVNEAHSDLMDRLLRRLFRFAEDAFFTDPDEEKAVVTLLAVGGYARRELNFHSDVDLLFLYHPPLSEHVKTVAKRIELWLWDAQLTVGSATRTVKETIDLARHDLSVRTNIMAPRYLAGSGILFHRFVHSVRTDLFHKPRSFVDNQLEGLHARHHREGDSLYLLQPNVKEGAGGLRDYHAAYWSLQATQPGGGRIDDFLHLGLLTEAESRDYLGALDFLWRVRNEAHLATGRKSDQLSFELQERIAEALGYGAPDEPGSELPVERFMSDYYRHASVVQRFSLLAIEQCHARVRGNVRRGKRREIEQGFRIVERQLEIPHTSLLADDPLRLLSAFAVAQDHDVPLSRKARRLIRENLYRIDDAYRVRPEARSLFFRILEGERRVMRSLMAMNETGLLARFLPEWEHIVNRWQHVMYHTYTVDVHTIFLVEELRRLWRGDYQKALPELTELMRNVDDRIVLFLGCLMHDIGKGFGGNHSALGAERARRCVERLGLSPERVDRVVFLVAEHLKMSHIAQSRDLSDPKLILEFARLVGDRVRLRDLYLVTFADIRASSNKAWTDWKGQLLRELFERTSELIESGSDDPSKAIELIDRRVEQRRVTAADELRALGVADTKVQAFFEMMPRRYFTAHKPRQIARHALVVLSFGSGRMMATAVREMRGDFSEFIVCTMDRVGLYTDIAGTLTAHSINILGSHVYTTRAGLALEVYRVATPNGGDEVRRMVWSEFNASLEAMLKGDLGVRDLLKRRGLRVGHTPAPAQAPSEVKITNEESDFYTIVDVTANDRLGLLHDLTGVVSERGYEIYISKAATVLDQVTDTFYLKDREGKKLSDLDAIEDMRVALLDVVEPGSPGVR